MKILGIFVTAIEWYDAAICISFATILSELFLPKLAKSDMFFFYFYLIFSSFIGRPIGSYLFGKYSDNNNRIKSAYISFFLMVFASLLLAFLPTYQQIGKFSTIFFVLIKLIQGIAIGGNYGISVYTIENAKKKYFISSLISCGIFIGFWFGSLVASLIFKYFENEFISSYGWRICLISSFILALPVLWNFSSIKNEPQNVCNDLKEKTSFNLKDFFKSCVFLLLDMFPFYTFFTFLPNYKIMQLNFDASTIWFQHSVGMLIIVIFTPIVGLLADKYSPVKFLKISSLLLIGSSIFYSWDGIFWSIYFGLMLSFCYGALYGYLALIFPAKTRAKTSGLALSLTATITNALLPNLLQILEKNPYFLSFIIIIIGSAIFILLSKEKNV